MFTWISKKELIVWFVHFTDSSIMDFYLLSFLFIILQFPIPFDEFLKHLCQIYCRKKLFPIIFIPNYFYDTLL